MDKAQAISRAQAAAKMYGRASRELRKRHMDEYWEILRELQQQSGVPVRHRRTKDERRRADIEAAKALLAEEGLLPG